MAEFETQISPQVQNTLSELENERKAIVDEKYKGWGAIIFSGVVIFLMGALGVIIAGLLLGLCGIGYGIYVLYAISEKEKSYKDRYKRDVIGATLVAIDANLTFDGAFISAELHF